MPDFKVIGPSEFAPPGGNPFPVENYSQRYLAQGDSWFSLGAALFLSTTNLLLDMQLSRSTLIVDCARPGKLLSLMTNATTDPRFLELLSGSRTKWPWDALLISGGGNDLVAAAAVGGSADPALRLLLRPDEWGPQPDASRYLSAAGWKTFTDHMDEVFGLLLAQVDKAVHPDMPIVMHAYDYITPRNAPAGPGLGPWLFKALILYGIPAIDWNALADLLIDRLAQVLLAFKTANPARNICIVDTRGLLQRAAPGSTGRSGGWLNEIHPTAQGYQTLQPRWRETLDTFPRLDAI